jgi:hypothetical protein
VNLSTERHEYWQNYIANDLSSNIISIYRYRLLRNHFFRSVTEFSSANELYKLTFGSKCWTHSAKDTLWYWLPQATAVVDQHQSTHPVQSPDTKFSRRRENKREISLSSVSVSVFVLWQKKRIFQHHFFLALSVTSLHHTSKQQDRNGPAEKWNSEHIQLTFFVFFVTF